VLTGTLSTQYIVISPFRGPIPRRLALTYILHLLPVRRTTAVSMRLFFRNTDMQQLVTCGAFSRLKIKTTLNLAGVAIISNEYAGSQQIILF